MKRACSELTMLGDSNLDSLKYRLLSVVYNATSTGDSLSEIESELSKILFPESDGEINFDEHFSDLALAYADVSPHIAKAEEIQRRINGDRAFTGSLAGLLEAIISPTVAINATGDIQASNSSASRLGWQIGNIVNLLNLESQPKSDIENFLNASDQGDVYVGTAFIEAMNARETLIVIRDMSRAMALAPRKLFLLSTIDLDFDDEVLSQFGKAYKLTSAERDVVGLLVRGYTPKDTATLRGTSEDTVRTQIKVIKSKVQVADLPALVRLFLGFVNSMVVPDFVVKSDSEVARSRQPQKVTQFTLRDGRQMEVWFQGDPNGRPVLLFQNMPYGVELPVAAQQFCLKNGLQVIAPYRPGYGNSTSLSIKNDTDYLNTVSDDYAEVIERLGIRKVVSLGYSVGSAFSLNFAFRHPHLVRSQIAVSRVPIWRDAWMNDTPVRQRLMLKLVRDFPGMASLFAGVALNHLNDGKMQKFIADSVHGCPTDELIIKDPEILNPMLRDIYKGFRSGVGTFVRECRIPLIDMSDIARECPHKFHIIHGDRDVIIPLAQSEVFVEDVPGSTLQIIPGGGQLLSYSHWRPVLTAVYNAWT